MSEELSEIARLREENAALLARLSDSEETLRAIRSGEVDALVVEGASGPQIFILQTSDAESIRFRSDILGKVSDAVVAIDRDRHVVYLNTAAEQQYGITAGKSLGRPLEEIYEESWLSENDRASSIKSLGRFGHWRGRNIHHKSDGAVIHVDSAVSVLADTDGSPTGTLHVIRDVTRQTEIEEALRESESAQRITAENLHLILQASGAVTWQWRVDTGELSWSPGFRTLYGFPPEFAGNFSEWCKAVQPDDLAVMEARISEMLGDPQDNDWQVEFRINHPQLGIRWISGRGTMIRDENHQAVLMRGINFDVSDRKEADETLRENQARLQLTLKAVQMGDWELDLDTDQTSRSLLHDQIFGYPEGTADWGLKRFLGHVHPEDREAVGLLFRESVRESKEWHFECRILRTDGEQRWIAAHGSIFGYAHNNRKRMLGVVSDITPRKLAEETLRQNEALFSTIIEQAPGGVYVVDDQFKMMRINPLARPTFASAEPVIGRDLTEIMRILWGVEVGHEIASRFRHTLDTGEATVSTRFTRQRQDLGVERSYDWETRRITLPNGHHGVVCYYTDVTEQWRLEEALRASEQRATDIVQSISDGFITMDADWRITYLSNRGAEMLGPLGKTADNVIGRNLWEEFPHALDCEIEDNLRLAMDGMSSVQFEVYDMALDCWLDIRAYPSSSGLSVYFLDITERKAAEQSLAEQAAALLTADRSKNEFLAMLAHELRNPLAPMRNATGILGLPAAPPEEKERAQHLIARQIDNMSRMIDDLLDVSRITEGKIELSLRPTLLQDVLNAAAEVARPSTVANNQELYLEMPEEPVFVNADATRLEQVFGNLLGNAVKYSGRESRIALIARRVSDEEILIHVEDNGTGIDPELLPRVFDLFVQASRTLDRSHGGLGIGLTIVNRLVKLHGGTIGARSDGLGKGTEFLITLPVIPAPAADRLNDLQPNAPARPLRILIVDDNIDSAETMAMLQELEGHHTCIAHTGPDAVTRAAEFLPEVILLDIGLPGMDGFEVARRIREMPAMGRAFLVALTGYGTDDDREKAREAGFNRHLTKPADLELLRQWFTTLF